jgi:hypothetical protein
MKQFLLSCFLFLWSFFSLGQKEYKVVTYDNGDRYEGYFVNDLKNGEGTYYWKNGNRYVGEWQDGERTGFGVFTWTDGDIYKGYFKAGKRGGYGEYYAANKDIANCPGARIYKGNWNGGEKWGPGRCFNEKGDFIYGSLPGAEGVSDFANDKPIGYYPNKTVWWQQRINYERKLLAGNWKAYYIYGGSRESQYTFYGFEKDKAILIGEKIHFIVNETDVYAKFNYVFENQTIASLSINLERQRFASYGVYDASDFPNASLEVETRRSIKTPIDCLTDFSSSICHGCRWAGGRNYIQIPGESLKESIIHIAFTTKNCNGNIFLIRD